MSTVNQVKAAPAFWPTRLYVAFNAARVTFAALLLVLASVVVWSFVQAVDHWTWVAWVILPLVAANALWISGGAATAILGLMAPAPIGRRPAETWQPTGRTAILVTLCGERPEPVSRYLAQLSAGLAAQGLQDQTQIFVLSDTYDEAACRREDAALADLISAGAVAFRRRSHRIGRKPGNIADWLAMHGHSVDYMVVLDADSRMSVASIRHLIWTLESNPTYGLCQAGISLIPGRTRFGKYQRITSRLLSKTFGAGFSAWSGEAGNYWGHNAIIRVEAFRSAAQLPKLTGVPPFGGMVLSHDFIEAAWIRRAGWGVVLCPDIKGSAEDAPQTLPDFFKRDRRWCQGNLQHLRLVAERGLHPLSRYHLLTGIFSYLAAPIWLVLLLVLSSGLVSVWGFLPVLSVAAILLIPKFCALIDALPKARTSTRQRVYLRAWIAELILSTLLAPLIMLRQAIFVAAVIAGRDCGWKSPQVQRLRMPLGWPEATLGLAMLFYAVGSGAAGAFWMGLVVVPLLAAPVLMPILNEVPR